MGRRPKLTEVVNVPEMDILTVQDLVSVNGEPGESSVENKQEEHPEISDPAWSKWVMTQFEPDELFDGYPVVHGLRRVVNKVLGPITGTFSSVLQSPSSANGMHACVKVDVTIQWVYNEVGEAAHQRVFSGVADVGSFNSDPMFARHSSSTAETKAESRALRRALNLKVLAAEEICESMSVRDTDPTMMNRSQMNFIDMMCQPERLNINVIKLLNAGETKHDTYKDVSYTTAVKIFNYLNQLQTGVKQIPENLKGYKPNWRGE